MQNSKNNDKAETTFSSDSITSIPTTYSVEATHTLASMSAFDMEQNWPSEDENDCLSSYDEESSSLSYHEESEFESLIKCDEWGEARSLYDNSLNKPDLLFIDEDGNNILHHAMCGIANHKEQQANINYLVDKAIEKGICLKLNNDYESPLHQIAYLYKETDELVTFFQKLIDIATEDDLNCYDRWGKTPLLEAIEQKKQRFALMLASDHRVNINVFKIDANIQCQNYTTSGTSAVQMAENNELANVISYIKERDSYNPNANYSYNEIDVLTNDFAKISVRTNTASMRCLIKSFGKKVFSFREKPCWSMSILHLIVVNSPDLSTVELLLNLAQINKLLPDNHKLSFQEHYNFVNYQASLHCTALGRNLASKPSKELILAFLRCPSFNPNIMQFLGRETLPHTLVSLRDEDLLFEAAKHPSIDFDLTNEIGISPLRSACINQDYESIQRLSLLQKLGKEINPNDVGNIPDILTHLINYIEDSWFNPFGDVQKVINTTENRELCTKDLLDLYESKFHLKDDLTPDDRAEVEKRTKLPIQLVYLNGKKEEIELSCEFFNGLVPSGDTEHRYEPLAIVAAKTGCIKTFKALLDFDSFQGNIFCDSMIHKDESIDHDFKEYYKLRIDKITLKKSSDAKGPDIHQKHNKLEKNKPNHFNTDLTIPGTHFAQTFAQRLAIANLKRNDHTHKLDVYSRRLDSLARLLEGDNICAAVCFDGENILFATNHGSKKHNKEDYTALVDEVKNHFSMYAKEDFLYISKLRDSRIELVTQSSTLKLVQLATKLKGSRKSDLVERIKSLINEFTPKLCNNINRLSDIEWDYDDYRLTDETVKQVLKKYNIDYGNALSRLSNKTHILSEIVTIVTRLALDVKKIEQSLEEGRATGFDIKLVTAFKNEQFQEIQDIGSGVHAEMRIVNDILKQQSSINMRYYVGISKLCCAHCKLTFDHLENFSNDYEHNLFSARGAHGKAFPWPIPDFLQTEEGFRRVFQLDQQLVNLYSSVKSRDEANQIIEDIAKCKNLFPVLDIHKPGRRQYADFSETRPAMTYKAMSHSDDSVDSVIGPLMPCWNALPVSMHDGAHPSTGTTTTMSTANPSRSASTNYGIHTNNDMTHLQRQIERGNRVDTNIVRKK